MNTVQLNLARKWRSKNFDQVIGQDLSIRILKNTLYFNQFFPVYLFAGQRGCGKTSTARIFASAINCEQLSNFQKNPKQCSFPCLTCASCVAMSKNQHADFIEIDAASHTGVDNVRQIVEAASLLPLMGHKKIYLIDEAHMLSKAAFNAFLKILEEPPAAVLFILATTDHQKIIETVRSRCFQLFFKPIAQKSLVDHLAHICAMESIKYEEDALALITREVSGSVRDALNLLEQVRFSSGIVSLSAVRQVLGHIDDDHLWHLLSLVFKGDQKGLLSFCEKISLTSFSASYIWKKLIELLRIALWNKHGINKHEATMSDSFIKLRECSLMQVQQFLEHLYQNEMMFLKTTEPHAFLEMIFLHMCYKNRSHNNSESSPLAQAAADSLESQVSEIDNDEDDDADSDNEEYDGQEARVSREWNTFLQRVGTLQDPLVASIFQQAQPLNIDQQNMLVITFSSRLLLFKDLLDDTKNSWLPVLQNIFSQVVDIKALFVQEQDLPKAKHIKNVSEDVNRSQNEAPTAIAQDSPRKQNFSHQNKKSTQSGLIIDISDVQHWQKTHMLLRYFPGIITESKENRL